MKVGRNDPCPCGSGKKNKKCCLEKSKVSDLGYKRISKIQDGLVNKLTRYVAHDLGDRVINAAMSQFFFQEDLDPSSQWREITSEYTTVFWPWMFYLFEVDVPDIDQEDIFGLMPPDTTVAEMFMQDKGKNLEPLELELLSACNRVQFSFFEVHSSQPEHGFQAVDLLTGQRRQVNDISASQHLVPGDIIFALITEVRGVTINVGSAKYKFYPRFKPTILEFRKELEEGFGHVTNELLIDLEFELRDLLFFLQDALFEPPDVRNTDGDPLSFRTLHYDIASPEEAFEALAPLCVHQTKDELKNQAKLDADNRVHKARFAWSREGHAMSKGLDNTSLGQVSIEGDKMTVEVNSEAREEMIKLEIEKRLGHKASYKVTDIRPLESVMAEAASNPASSRHNEEQKALQNTPEVQEAIKDMLNKHWQGWLDTEIPALGGKTPRQASQTEDGREALQALLRDLEARDEHSGMPVSQQPYVDWARKELGLPDT